MHIMFLPYEFVCFVFGVSISEPQTDKVNANYICLYPCIYMLYVYLTL